MTCHTAALSRPARPIRLLRSITRKQGWHVSPAPDRQSNSPCRHNRHTDTEQTRSPCRCVGCASEHYQCACETMPLRRSPTDRCADANVSENFSQRPRMDRKSCPEPGRKKKVPGIVRSPRSNHANGCLAKSSPAPRTRKTRAGEHQKMEIKAKILMSFVGTVIKFSQVSNRSNSVQCLGS